ncbi:HsdR family type I site-specific deoxyribonuclease [Streptomyces sp. JV178]|uniref:type I restriction endonuclease subunit R n=1 Tax=Streptomyces sp. JV178 TaxID=858632 RepID=UPI000C1B0EDC|nr:type I restriction endonuclease subunit R [Streptomyces sp. JV178]PIM71044.1 HsdR family type I site-specific deoxyribonuclease [Streptomyces sp. JV178]
MTTESEPTAPGTGGDPDAGQLAVSEIEASHAEALTFSEQDWEIDALDKLGEHWQPVSGKDLWPERDPERKEDLVLYPRLRRAIATRYPHLPESAVGTVVSELLKQSTGSDIRENWAFYRRLTGGVKVAYEEPLTGAEKHETVWPVDFDNPHGNDLVAASQVRVKGVRGREFVFDIVLYVNGLPLAVIELKKDSGPDDARKAYDQIQNYRRELKRDGVFRTILLAVASDGITARLGTPFTPWQHMAPWHADQDGVLLRKHERRDGRALERMIHGPLDPERFLDLIAFYLSYSAEGTGGEVDTVKLAKAHQYFAVKEAVAATEAAVATDGRAGVVWHTQGAGKSEEMVFYTGKVSQTPELSNPTVVLLTDRIDLDSQLYRTFVRSNSLHRLIGDLPEKAENSGQLKTLLTRRENSGGVVFTTLQKFRLSKEEKEAGARHPVISERRDIVVVVDEAHRSHYDFEDGFARHLRDALPNATFLAFTGTPIDNTTGSTAGVFGPVIHTYDLTQAVDDGATVPVFYEPILHKVKIPEEIDLDDLNAQAEGLVEGLSEAEQARARRRFASFENLIGSRERIDEVAATVLRHWDARRTEMKKLTGRTGKGMIVCSSRAIAARLFNALARLRPEWVGERDETTGLYPDKTGKIRVVFTGNAGHDTDEVADYVRTPTQLKEIQKRVVDEDDELELVIVQSLWLTGFDAPPLHTLYLDRRMRGAALMQAIARVNRTWDEKPSGLVVDFLGVAHHITAALAEYSPADRERKTIGAPLDEALSSVRRMHQRIEDLLRPCGWREVLDADGYAEALSTVLEFLEEAQPELEPGKPTRQQLFMHFARLLSRSFSLCATHPEIQDLVPDIHFFAAVRTSREKIAADEREDEGLATEADVARLIEQLNAQAVAADGVVDIYDAAGLTKPDISHLDEGFIQQVRASSRPDLAIRALRRALNAQIRQTHSGNVVRQKAFTEKMQEVINRYHNGLLTSAETIELLVEFSREVAENPARAQDLGLTYDELAFYDAVAANPSALEMGHGVLAEIAQKLCDLVRKDVTVDWRVKGQARDRIRGKVKFLLKLYGYPPDEEPGAIERVLKQTEAKAEEWA